MAQLNLFLWRQSPDFLLHVTFFCHFFLSAFSHLGGWSGNKLIFQDFFFLIAVMWCIHESRTASPVIMALGINALSIILDIIVLAVAFSKKNSIEEFSSVMAIFNLILRLGSSFVLVQVLANRDELDGSSPQSSSSAPPSSIGEESSRSTTRRSSKPTNGFKGYFGNSEPATLPDIPPTFVQHQ